MRTTQIKPLMKQKMFYKTEKLIINLTSTLSQLQEHWELPLNQQKQHAIICKAEKIVQRMKEKTLCWPESLTDIIEIGNWTQENNESYTIEITLEIETKLSEQGRKKYGAKFIIGNPSKNSKLKKDLKKFLETQKSSKGIGAMEGPWVYSN